MRILYGICGEGMGHCTRSSVLIQELQKEHHLKIVSSNRAYHFLQEKFSDVQEIGGFTLTYKNNELKRRSTFKDNCVKAPSIFRRAFQLWKLVRKFKPQLIISDFEPFSAYCGLILRIPVISIDNQHIIWTDVDGKSNCPRLEWFLVRFVVKATIPTAKHYVVLTYFFPKNHWKNVSLVPPLLRPQILQEKPRKNDFVLVYQTSSNNLKLIEELRRIPHKFLIYGFDKESQEGNLTFKKFNEKEFFTELAQCQAVISNGGFSLISDALALHKPVLSLPIYKQTEQYLNALYLRKLGYGQYAEKMNSEIIQEFLQSLPQFQPQLEKISWKKSNEETFALMKNLIAQYAKV